MVLLVSKAIVSAYPQMSYFEISMNHIIHVAVIYRFEDLLYTMRGIGFWVVLSGDDVFEQLTAGDQIEDQIMRTFFLDTVV